MKLGVVATNLASVLPRASPVAALQRLREVRKRAARDAAMGYGRLGRLGVAAAHLLLPLKSRVGWLAGIPVPLSLLVSGRRQAIWVADRSELLALTDIFLAGEYAAAGSKGPQVILDLGANVGAATLYFRDRFPSALIYAVEPDPATFKRLQRNVGHVAGVVVVNCAVAGRSGRARFEHCKHSWSSHLAAEANTDMGVDVDVVSFDDLLAELGLDHVDLMKMDVEGAEFALLDAASSLKVVEELVGELHPWHRDAPGDVDAWLQATAASAGFAVPEVKTGTGLFLLRRD